MLLFSGLHSELSGEDETAREQREKRRQQGALLGHNRCCFSPSSWSHYPLSGDLNEAFVERSASPRAFKEIVLLKKKKKKKVYDGTVGTPTV